MKMGPNLVAFSPVQTGTIPYNFTPFDFSQPSVQVIPDIGLTFINLMGSTAVTVMALFDEVGFLPILVVLLLAGAALWYLYHFVTEQPRSETIQLSGGLDTLGDATDSPYMRQAAKISRNAAKFGRKFSNKNPFRR